MTETELHWNDLQILFEHLHASGTHQKALRLFGEKLEELHGTEGEPLGPQGEVPDHGEDEGGE